MDAVKHCTSCRKLIAENAPHGLCPECLIRAGLPTGAAVQSGSQTQDNKIPFIAPSIVDIAHAFPALDIVRFVGQGGMGAVYQARQKALDRIVALKILPPSIGNDSAFAERFAREAKALAMLNHPGIVTLYEFGNDNGYFFFLMEFVDGVNLRHLLESGRLSPREALAIVPQICDALQYAHDHGIVHRDIKPENILIDRQGRIKIADFGLAKLIGAKVDRPVSNVVSDSMVLTQTGKVMGTPQYMAPEQVSHPADVDHRADIYSLGVVLYQMLTGELPGQRLEPPSRKVQLDIRLDEVVLRALEKEPDRRYQQASHVKNDVDTIASSDPATSTAPSSKTLENREIASLKSWVFLAVSIAFFISAFFVGEKAFARYQSDHAFDYSAVTMVLNQIAAVGFLIAAYKHRNRAKTAVYHMVPIAALIIFIGQSWFWTSDRLSGVISSNGSGDQEFEISVNSLVPSGNTTARFLDIDRSKLIEPPFQFSIWSREKKHEWLRDNGIDLMVEGNQISAWRLLTPVDNELRLAKIPSDSWAIEVDQGNLLPEKGDAIQFLDAGIELVQIQLKQRPTHDENTFFYRTANRTQGHMKVAGMKLNANGEPVGLKFRFRKFLKVSQLAPVVKPAEVPTKTLVLQPGQSIQSTIASASVGSTIHIPAGLYTENLIITNSISLEGDGWDKTIIRAARSIVTASENDLAQASQEFRSVKNSTEADILRKKWRERLGGPTLMVLNAREVKIKGMQFSAPAPSKVEGLMGEAIVQFTGTSNSTMTQCAVVGPYFDGIHVMDKSSITIQDTLVAGLWGTGIAIQGGRNQEPASSVNIIGCEIRNCYHRCITIGSGSDSTLIKDSIISGSAWHGIRYDDASPNIIHCAIYGNARSGIYASGKTAARIHNNVFYGNEMNGISCWYQNQDTLEQNWFVTNRREAISVLGNSKPKVQKNIFYQNPVAIFGSAIGGEKVPAFGNPVLVSNLFWMNENDYFISSPTNASSVKSTPLPSDSGSILANPQFVDVTSKDFGFKTNSPALALFDGSAAPMQPVVKWPLTAAEQTIIPDSDTRDYQAWKKPGEPSPSERKMQQDNEKQMRQAQMDSRKLVEEAFRTDNLEARNASITEILNRIKSGNDTTVLSGLTALRSISEVEFDKNPFRDPVRNHLHSTNEAIRAAAVISLPLVNPDPSDLERLLTMGSDPSIEVRKVLAGSLFAIGNKNLSGRAGIPVVQLLSDKDEGVIESVLRSIWGATVSPELEKRIVELSRTQKHGYTALYFALSTMANKSESTVDRLIEYLADPDVINVSGRALWGLQHGVPQNLQPKVAQAVLRLLEKRSNPRTQQDCLSILSEYGTLDDLAGLEKIHSRAALSEKLKTSIEKTAETIRSRSKK